ncbi:MAG: substrate-binding domain-containing protein [Anaerolineae bacterium]|nr:substrate-binding domain-containing protein [Anaerolineae bacterium]
MRQKTSVRPTVGFLSTWSVYEGTAIDGYTHTLSQGICAEALRSAGVEEDARLIAFGEHRREDGRAAMQQILSSGAPFTALLASNDLSALGAIEVLHAAGRCIPDDVAVIGFDDILEARSHLPPLTTVRHPTFRLGYQAVLSLLDAIEDRRTGETRTRVPTQLVIRQSCGCRPESLPVASLLSATPSDRQATQAALARAMAEATLVEARHTTRQEIETLSLSLVQAFTSSLSCGDPGPFDTALQQLFDWLEGHGKLVLV